MKNNVTQNMFPNVPPLMKPSMKLHMKTNVRQNMNSPVPQHMKMNVTQCKSYSITVTLLVVHKENIFLRFLVIGTRGRNFIPTPGWSMFWVGIKFLLPGWSI